MILSLALVLVLFSCLNNHQKKILMDLGYTKVEIAAMDELGLRDELLKKNLYSDSLASALIQKSVDTKHLDLYYLHSNLSDTNLFVTDEIILINDKLLKYGYSQELINQLLENLSFREMTPLLVFEIMGDVTPYIEDVIEHRQENEGQFVLSNDYLKAYENPKTVNVALNELMLVNKKNQLPSGYTPLDLTMISRGCRFSDMSAAAPAAAAFEAMCAEAKNQGMILASTSAYRDYDYQKELYDQMVQSDGQEVAERYVIQAGYSEHQSGYAIDFGSLSEPDVPFAQSPEYRWVCEVAASYGFILRYPQGYESITGIAFESYHWRYVGVEAAEKINASGLTFDEYYKLYIEE